jgi:hypothetical protein
MTNSHEISRPNGAKFVPICFGWLFGGSGVSATKLSGGSAGGAACLVGARAVVRAGFGLVGELGKTVKSRSTFCRIWELFPGLDVWVATALRLSPPLEVLRLLIRTSTTTKARRKR